MSSCWKLVGKSSIAGSKSIINGRRTTRGNTSEEEEEEEEEMQMRGRLEVVLEVEEEEEQRQERHQRERERGGKNMKERREKSSETRCAINERKRRTPALG